ncbi:MAG TPA: formylglycine-generating enzyme family protein [Desulfocapsa sulfexigens]|nr:formylglycine-generating enzyme family protein [Desulfocapsa sulfexigens]
MSTRKPPEKFPALWASAWGEDTYGYWQAFEIRGVRQVMRWIPEGEFLMGSPENEAERSENEKQHKVVIPSGFWLADTTCTQQLWQAVMGNNPSDFDDDLQNPVDSVSWESCEEFIKKANHLLQFDWFSLPTEEQWEYACRAGTTTPFNTGETINTDQANFDGNHPYKKAEGKGAFRDTTVPVLEFAPNSWGLFQMHGNIWEWCEDVYKTDYSGKSVPEDEKSSSQRVLRGGSCLNFACYLRSATRFANSPGERHHHIGLRLAGGFDPQVSR